MTEISFADLNLVEPICRSLLAENYTTPTPIQAQCIPHLLEGGDLLGCAQTGTGKTAAFALPVLQRLSANPKSAARKTARALVLTPTRELAIQIAESFQRYGRHLKLRHTTVYGGVGYGPQIKALSNGVDVLIATPGRLIDLMGQGHVRMEGIEILILDEADRMLDMGFFRDVKRILERMPKERQTLLFSATMPAEVSTLAASILKNPKRVEVVAESSIADRIDEHVMFVDRGNKKALLLEILKDQAAKRVLVFTRTKHGANRLSQQLDENKIRSEAIHGNKSQAARQKALQMFRSGKVRVLVATDVVARGIDVDCVTHVVNFEISNEPASYVHRIGRTARAGEAGIALSMCDADERAYLRDIEHLLGRSIPVYADQPYHSEELAVSHLRGAGRRPPQGGGGGRNFRPRNGGNGNGRGGNGRSQGQGSHRTRH